jgi:hypothetical protein
MVSTGRIKDRLKHLLAYYAVEYVKAYKTALVLSIRDQKNNAKAKFDQPEWVLMLDNSHTRKNPQIEGEVYVGEGFKKKVWWSMAKNYVVTETQIKEKKEEAKEGGADAPASPSAASSSSPKGAMSPASDSDAVASGTEPDLRVWLDDSCAESCMNPSCGEKFGLLKRRTHCRHCGEIFCSACTKSKIGEDKFCEPCHTLRTATASPDALLPVLKRPTEKVRILNFYKYKVALHDTELFAAAGAANAAAGVGMPEGAADKFMLVLTHKRSTRPQPTIAFDSKEERDKWKGLLQSASSWSPAPITIDPVLRKAFTVSYNRLRWHAWVWGNWDIDGSESEMLADVLYEVLEREIFGAELSKLGPMPRKLAYKAIIGMLESAVSACWSGIMKGLAAIRPPLEEKVGDMLGPLFETEAKVKGEIQGPIEVAATKGLESAEADLQKLFASNLPVIAAAGEAELNLIHNSLLEFIEEWEKSADKSARHFAWTYEWVRWRGDWLYSFKQKPISEMIDTKLNDEEASGPSRTLASDLNNDMKDLNQSAFIVLGRAINKADVADPIAELRAHYPDIITRAAQDMTSILQWRMVKALDGTLRGPLLQVTNEIVTTITKPLDAMIPDLIKDIVDPARACMEIISDVLTIKEQELITIASAKVKEGIIEQGKQLAARGLVRV